MSTPHLIPASVSNPKLKEDETCFFWSASFELGQKNLIVNMMFIFHMSAKLQGFAANGIPVHTKMGMLRPYMFDCIFCVRDHSI